MRVNRSIAMLVALGAIVGPGTGAAAQTATPSHQPPVAFTGNVLCGDQVRPDTTEFGDGVAKHRGGAWHPTATMSDPRLEGDYYISFDDDQYTKPLGTAVGAGT